MVAEKTTRKQLRSFGLILAGGFTVIALAPMIRSHSPRSWALVVAILFGTAGLIFPALLRPVYRVWMTIGEVLAWVNTRIILTILYYALIVPIGFMLRMRGKDPMRLKFERDAETYRIIREKRQASHMLHPY
jgi:heme/copper-type cytochrome/quinol oxidase subunit 4